MSAPVIKVENLSKQYRIGERQGYKTFREAIVNLSKAPFCRWNGSNPHAKIRNLQSDTIWALKDVSFEVEQGEVVGVIGRNGAGKSTLLKILSKITEPTSGRVELKGRVGSLLEVGTGFHPELTGHENIYLYGAILGMDRWEVTRKFDEIVNFADLEKFIDTPVKRYSSGMYMRLAFAVAAHLEPEILLVDEVLAVGDLSFQHKCIGKMESVAGEGRTVLFVSHNMAAIQSLCSKTILLNSGILNFSGDTLEAIQQYTISGQISNGSKISLKHHQNRLERFEPILKCIEIEANNIPSVNIGMGETLKLSVSFRGQKPVLGLGLSFEDHLGRRLFLASTEYTSRNLFKNSKNKGKLICSLPKLLLLPGTYFITLILIGPTGLIDKIERAASFKVEERDVFGTGNFPSRGKGFFYMPADWSFEK